MPTTVADHGTKRVQVVVAVIRDPEDWNQVLIARRSAQAHQGGKWEFPGGKQELSETATAALKRELREELAIEATAMQPLIAIQHQYPDKAVLLNVWEVTAFEGAPKGNEGQPIRWVAATDLSAYDFPAANTPIVTAVQLPALYWITPPGTDADNVADNAIALLEQRLQAGVQLVQLRLKATDSEALLTIVKRCAAMCQQYAARLLLNGDDCDLLCQSDRWQQAVSLIDGVHLTARQLTNLPAFVNDLPAGYWLAASCHNQQEIALAQQQGCHFVTLSPIAATTSHPDTKPLAPQTVQACLDASALPVYALGGLSQADIGAMRELGFQGVSGISRLMPR